MTKPNYVETVDPDEVTLHVRDVKKTGSKRLELFSTRKGHPPLGYRVGDEFLHGGRHYIIEKITEGDR